MPTVLLTGIEPFDGETINPSWEAARRLGSAVIGGATVAARQLPCVLSEVLDRLHGALEETRPDLVVCLGRASGRSDVSVERVAINLVDARIPDNAGRQPIDEPVIAGGPGAYFSTLPVKAIVRALRQGGVPASASLTAGTYNCNAIFYGLSHYIATRRRAARRLRARAVPAGNGGRASRSAQHGAGYAGGRRAAADRHRAGGAHRHPRRWRRGQLKGAR